jgi:hypothetical protein
MACRSACLLVSLVLGLAGCGGGSGQTKGAASGPGGLPSRSRAVSVTGPFSFHINLALDESVKCGDAPCDLPYLPKWHLYLKGTLNVSAGGDVTGEGAARIVEIGRCLTAMPRQSSCSAEPGNDGTFTVAGHTGPGGLDLTLSPVKPIELKVVHRTKTASGPIEVPFDSTYQGLIEGVLGGAGVFGTAFTAPLPADGKRLSDQPLRVFEGRFEQQARSGTAVHTIHAFGSWFFIDPATKMPEKAAPK